MASSGARKGGVMTIIPANLGILGFLSCSSSYCCRQKLKRLSHRGRNRYAHPSLVPDMIPVPLHCSIYRNQRSTVMDHSFQVDYKVLLIPSLRSQWHSSTLSSQFPKARTLTLLGHTCMDLSELGRYHLVLIRFCIWQSWCIVESHPILPQILTGYWKIPSGMLRTVLLVVFPFLSLCNLDR